MRKTEVTLIILLSLSSLWSCSDEPKVEPAPTVAQISPSYGQAGTIITITGTNFSSDLSRISVAFIDNKAAVIESANSTEIRVKAPAGGTSGPITVDVNGQSVQSPPFTFYSLYTYGSTRTGVNYIGTYWKDGIPSAISTNYSEITELVVAGADIHAVGYEFSPGFTSRYPVYWKNGNAIPLTGTDVHTIFTGIAVSGPDLYICGIQLNSLTIGIAKYWKNGQETILSDSEYATTTDIQVYGSDVYVTGSLYPDAVYWKNGVANFFSDGSTASAISVAGSDLYVCGTQHYQGGAHARVWKNGLSTRLTVPDNDINQREYEGATCLYVSGSDVYVGGGLRIDGNFGFVGYASKFWKNGIEVSVKEENQGLYVRCISEFDDDVITTVSSNLFNSSSFVYRNSEAIISSPGPEIRLTGHTIVTY